MIFIFCVMESDASPTHHPSLIRRSSTTTSVSEKHFHPNAFCCCRRCSDQPKNQNYLHYPITSTNYLLVTHWILESGFRLSNIILYHISFSTIIMSLLSSIASNTCRRSLLSTTTSSTTTNQQKSFYHPYRHDGILDHKSKYNIMNLVVALKIHTRGLINIVLKLSIKFHKLYVHPLCFCFVFVLVLGAHHDVKRDLSSVELIHIILHFYFFFLYINLYNRVFLSFQRNCMMSFQRRKLHHVRHML